MARIIWLVFFIGVNAHAAIISNWPICEKKMKTAEFSGEFIEALHNASTADGFSEILELNTLLFLKRNDYHGIQVNSEAATAVDKFNLANAEALKEAEKNYGVPGKVITSLLWMESRHGQNQGRFLLANVFVDLLQTDQPKNIKYLYQAAAKFTSKLTRSKRRGIASRARKRVKWALSELRALEKIWERDHTILTHLHGSFAGAFGMPQFEPSSYIAYARSTQNGHPPDLTLAPDAIQSVAYYLQQNGWRSNQHSQMHALLKYNNSHDYARAILKLSGISVRQSARIPASSMPKTK